MEPLDIARLQIATADHARDYYGQRGTLTFGRSDAIRYVAEAYSGKHLLREAWPIVEAYITEHPHVLTLGASDVEEAKRLRDGESAEIAEQAHGAMRRGEHEAAHALIDGAELANPDYRIGRRWTWGDLREFVNKDKVKNGEATA